MSLGAGLSSGDVDYFRLNIAGCFAAIRNSGKLIARQNVLDVLSGLRRLKKLTLMLCVELSVGRTGELAGKALKWVEKLLRPGSLSSVLFRRMLSGMLSVVLSLFREKFLMPQKKTCVVLKFILLCLLVDEKVSKSLEKPVDSQSGDAAGAGVSPEASVTLDRLKSLFRFIDQQQQKDDNASNNENLSEHIARHQADGDGDEDEIEVPPDQVWAAWRTQDQAAQRRDSQFLRRLRQTFDSLGVTDDSWYQ